MSRRILVADSLTIQKVVKIIFSRHDCEVVGAASLMEATSELARAPVELIVADAALSGVRSPADLAHLANSAGKPVPVVLLVGSYEAINETQFADAGISTIVRKPFEGADLLAAAASALPGLVPNDAGKAEAAVHIPPPPPMSRAKPQIPLDLGSPTGAAEVSFSLASPGVEDAAGAPPVFSLDDGVVEHSGPRPGAVALDVAESGDAAELGGDLGAMVARSVAGLSIDESQRGRRAFPDSGQGAAQESSLPGGLDLNATAAGTPEIPLRETPHHRRTHYIPPPGAAGIPTIAPGQTPQMQVRPTTIPPLPPPPQTGGGSGLAGVSLPSEPLALPDEKIVAAVRHAVEDYCARHFRSIAREVISAELKRLAEEKARHLVDGFS